MIATQIFIIVYKFNTRPVLNMLGLFMFNVHYLP